jgi:hypothetical protein
MPSAPSLTIDGTAPIGLSLEEEKQLLQLRESVRLTDDSERTGGEPDCGEEEELTQLRAQLAARDAEIFGLTEEVVSLRADNSSLRSEIGRLLMLPAAAATPSPPRRAASPTSIDAAARWLKQGATAAELCQNGFSAVQLKEAGCTAKQLTQAGFSLAQLIESGCSASQLQETFGFSVAQLVQLGFTAGQLKAEIAASPRELHEEAKVPMESLLDAGFTPSELREGGLSPLTQLVQAGSSAAQLLEAGFGAKQLGAAGFTDRQLAAARAEKDAFSPDRLSALEQVFDDARERRRE